MTRERREDARVTFPSYRVASVEDLLSRCTPGIQRLVLVARRAILRAVPGSTERLRAGWGILGYDAPRYFAYVAPQRDHVRVGFERGVLLRDPSRLLEGSGTQVRHVVRSPADLRRPAFLALLREAAGAAVRGAVKRPRGARAQFRGTRSAGTGRAPGRRSPPSQ